jgi:hypothetical protein
MAAHAFDAQVGGGESLPMRPVILRLKVMNEHHDQPVTEEASPDQSVSTTTERAAEAWRQWWRAAADQMWPAWKGLNRWEETAAEELDQVLGEFILLLWSVYRFAPSVDGPALFDQILDADLHPTFNDPVLEDIVEVAFALGAAWADDRGRDTTTAPSVTVHPLPQQQS